MFKENVADIKDRVKFKDTITMDRTKTHTAQQKTRARSNEHKT